MRRATLYVVNLARFSIKPPVQASEDESSTGGPASPVAPTSVVYAEAARHTETADLRTSLYP